MNSIDWRSLSIYSGVIFIALVAGLVLSGLLFEPTGLVIGLFIISPFVFIFVLKPKLPIFLLLLTIMFTEFYWVEIMQGYLKPFHIISILLFISFSVFNVKILNHSRIFWLFILFIALCLISIAYSDDMWDSLRSFVLPLILFSIALSIGLSLYKTTINEDIFMKIILYGSIITVIFGLIQMVAYTFMGALLTITEVQNGQIIFNKRPPSFFTEADTFGKFLSLPFLFCLPFAFDKNNKYHRKVKIIVVILLLGIIVNMTRSALVGIGFAGMLYIIYLLRRNSIGRNIAVIYGVAALLIVIVPFLFTTTKVIGSHEELTYRFQSLINPSMAIIEDPSTVYRKRGVEETIDGSVESLDAFLIGHGWGSAIISPKGELKDVGGTLFINILYYSGIFALIVYLLICVMIIRILVKAAKRERNLERRLFSEGILLSFLGMLIISQLASMWIAPEFWVVIGCAIYLELQNKRMHDNSSHP